MIGSGDEESALDMKWLRDDREATSLTEYFTSSYDRVECAKSRIVERDISLRNTRLHERFSHSFGFIVRCSRIVPWDEDMVDLPPFVEHPRGLDTSRIEQIVYTSDRWRRPEEKSDLSCGDRIDITIDTPRCHPWDEKPGRDSEDREEDEEEKEFFHEKI